MDRDSLKRSLELVRMLAAKMAKRLPSFLDIEDLVSSGNLGLARALKTFDPSKGVPFGAYATLKIRGAMLEDLRVRDPLTRDQRKDMSKVSAYLDFCRREILPDPTPEEISEATGLGVDRVEFLRRYPGKPLYLQDYVTPEGDLSLEEKFSDQKCPEEGIERLEKTRIARGVLERLPPSDKKVLTEYFLEGLRYREMGASRGVTETRAYQMVKSSLKKARRMADRIYWDYKE